MKKTYIAPVAKCDIATIEANLLTTSFEISDDPVDKQWAKEDKDWNIWSDDEE